jgi:hypothetical protein
MLKTQKLKKERQEYFAHNFEQTNKSKIQNGENYTNQNGAICNLI